METPVLQYKSRRNHVERIWDGQQIIVRKTFLEEAAFQQEVQVYEMLGDSTLPHGKILKVREKSMDMSCLPGENLVDHLSNQEANGVIRWPVWADLLNWILEFHRLTGLVMEDVNLRNFLYDIPTETLYGIDFEECKKGPLKTSICRLAAFIRLYDPADTPIKQEIAGFVLSGFAQQCHLPLEDLLQETEEQIKLLQRRRMYHK